MYLAVEIMCVVDPIDFRTVYLTVYLMVYLTVYLTVYLVVYLMVYLTVYLMVLLSRQPVVEEAPGGITLGRVPQGGPPPLSSGRGIPPAPGEGALWWGAHRGTVPLGAVGVQMKTHWSEVSHFAYPR